MLSNKLVFEIETSAIKLTIHSSYSNTGFTYAFGPDACGDLRRNAIAEDEVRAPPVASPSKLAGAVQSKMGRTFKLSILS
ncbi:hypothetical protein CDAR_60541 [Caerostris darwini]|uniref:Uncharacterized protein n=1 Tax=Caerostris darwini TaxID=1538125 RepID=A0AAV4U4U8_9ARAC|nr:hypothetical protein CDAR_60541 [Caerostris darwini]